MKLTKNILAKSISMALLCNGLFITSSILAEEKEAEKEKDGELIVVTAQRREQNFQDVAMSMTALTEDMLSNKGIDDLADLSENVPGLTINSPSLQNTKIALRGITSVGGGSQPVAVYMDEMPISGQGAQPAIKGFDVARIEVLRGPQGTLYGEGSFGGTIKVIMNKPDASKFAARINGSMSSIKDAETNSAMNLMLNIPLIENELAIRGTFQSRDNGGFIDAPNLGETDSNGAQLNSAQLSMQWFATEKLTIDMLASTQDIKTDGRNMGFEETTTITNPNFTVPGTYNARETSNSIASSGEDESERYNLTFTYDTDNYQFVSSSSYYTRDSNYDVDNAGLIPTVNSMGGNFGGGWNPFFSTPLEEFDGTNGMGVMDRTITEGNIFTQEFRLSYEMDEDLYWTAGLFYKDRSDSFSTVGTTTPDVSELVRESVDISLMIGAPPGTPGLSYAQNPEGVYAFAENNLKQTAIFSEITYNITDRLTGTVGGRYFKEDRDSNAENSGFFIQASTMLGMLGATGNPFAAVATVNQLNFPIIYIDNNSTNESTWKVNLSYELDENSDHMVYGTVSTGFRAGGINSFAATAEGLSGGAIPIDSLPRSFKPDTITNYEIGTKSSFNDGAIILNGALFHIEWDDVQTAWDPTGFGFASTLNAGKAHSTGLEFEGSIQVTNNLNVNFGYAYTEAELDSDLTHPLDSDIIIRATKGNSLPFIPEDAGSLGLNYTFNDIGAGLEGVLQASYSYKDERYASVIDAEELKLKAYGMTNVSFLVNSDDNWKARLFVNNLTDENKINGLVSIYRRGSLLQPRTVGVSFTLDF